MSITPATRALAQTPALTLYSVLMRAGRGQPGYPDERCVFSGQSEPLTPDVPPSQTSAWRAICRVLRSPMDSISCALFPSVCRICSSPLLRFTRTPVCEFCWSQVPSQAGILCARCGHDLGMAAFTPSALQRPLDPLCQLCRMVPPPFERAVSHGIYATRLRALIHLLKYDRIHPIATTLGRYVAQRILSIEALAAFDLLVVPVPLHRSKHRSRGFNQAELIARATLRGLHSQRPSQKLTLASGVLQHQRATESQAGHSPRQRRENLRGAFFVPRPSQVKGRHILLIDDIYTTGATARACSQVLRRAGACSVWVATVARAQLESANPLQFAQHSQTETPLHEDVAFWDLVSAHTASPADAVH
jgi:ComF family protein